MPSDRIVLVSDSPLTPSERRRNARELEQRMAELDRLDALYGLGSLPTGRPTRRPRRFTGTTALTVVVTGVVLMLVVLLHPSDQIQAVRRAIGLGAERGLPVPSLAGSGGVHAFSMTQPGSTDPVGWDPCSPIRYEVNPAGAPEGGQELIDNAIERASAATGLVFESEGSTDRRPFTSDFVPVGTDRPVVIAWSDAAELPELDGDVVGLGGGAAEQGVTGRRYYVTGAVALDTDAFTAAAIQQRPRTMEAIVLHEIGHVIGLDHVSEPTELMAARNNGQVELGPGALEGLAKLGSLPCS